MKPFLIPLSIIAALAAVLPSNALGQAEESPDSAYAVERRDSVEASSPRREASERTSLFNGVIPPSPQAAALARYAEYPVSHSTGIPEISVPLYEIDLGGYRLPISIDYHASGSRPDELPTCVGSGWVLNAGGAISRTILGKPDMFYDSAGFEDYTYFDRTNIRELLDDIVEKGADSSGDLHMILTDHTELDTESDRYTFNIGGDTGVFRYSYIDGEFVVLDNCNYWIYESGAANGDNHSSIIIETNDGVRYVCAEEGLSKTDTTPQAPCRESAPSTRTGRR